MEVVRFYLFTPATFTLQVITLVLIFVWSLFDPSTKMIPEGIELATFLLLALCFNQLHHLDSFLLLAGFLCYCYMGLCSILLRCTKLTN